MDILALSKSFERTKRATKLLPLMPPVRFEALAAIHACHEIEVMR